TGEEGPGEAGWTVSPGAGEVPRGLSCAGTPVDGSAAGSGAWGVFSGFCTTALSQGRSSACRRNQ
ncbi:MAG TPA: hypothetical protein P5219_10895, partial [Aminivibrio sp.]|nr:hypothetical protein [Aminivibrio sp.]